MQPKQRLSDTGHMRNQVLPVGAVVGDLLYFDSTGRHFRTSISDAISGYVAVIDSGNDTGTVCVANGVTIRKGGNGVGQKVYEDTANPTKLTITSGGKLIGIIKGAMGGVSVDTEGDTFFINCFMSTSSDCDSAWIIAQPYAFFNGNIFDLGFASTGDMFGDITQTGQGNSYNTTTGDIVNHDGVVVGNGTYKDFLNYCIAEIPSTYGASLRDYSMSKTTMNSTVIIRVNKDIDGLTAYFGESSYSAKYTCYPPEITGDNFTTQPNRDETDPYNPNYIAGNKPNPSNFVDISTAQDINGVKKFNDGVEIQRGNGGGAYSLDQILFNFNTGGYRHSIKTRHHSTIPNENAIDLFLWTSGAQNDLPNYQAASFQRGQSQIRSNELAIFGPDNQGYAGFYGTGGARRGYIGIGGVGETSIRYQNDDGSAHMFRDGIRVDNASTNFGQALLSLGGVGNIFVDAVGIGGGRLTGNNAGNRGFGGATNPQLKVSVGRDNTGFTNDASELHMYQNGSIGARITPVNANGDNFEMKRRLTLGYVGNAADIPVRCTSQIYGKYPSNISKFRSTTYVDRDGSIVGVNRIGHWMYPENDTGSITAYHQYDYIDRVPANSTTNAGYAATPRQQIVRRISSSFGYQDNAYCPEFLTNKDASDAGVSEGMFYRTNGTIKVRTSTNSDTREDLTLLNGRANYGGSYSTAQFKTINGVVYIKGLIAGSTNSTVAVLPVGYRPSEIRLLHTVSATGGLGLTRLDIDTNGTIILNGGQNSGRTSIDCSFAL